MPPEDFEKIVDIMSPALKVVTISPSVDAPSDYSRMKILNKKGITISLGHDKKATEEEILAALRLGTPANPIHMTHLFNVQSFHHRDVGLANFGILSKWPNLPEYQGVLEPTVEFVGDLLHLHPLVVQLILASKDWNKIALVTDSFLEPEAHSVITYGGREIEVTHKGCCPKVVLKGTTTMAGSCTTMVSMFHTLVRTFGGKHRSNGYTYLMMVFIITKCQLIKQYLCSQQIQLESAS
jgi:N-acetylglucosamine-6-phosphate deacetylase